MSMYLQPPTIEQEDPHEMVRKSEEKKRSELEKLEALGWMKKISYSIVNGINVLLLDQFIRGVIEQSLFINTSSSRVIFVVISVILFFPATLLLMDLIDKSYRKGSTLGFGVTVIISILVLTLYLYASQLRAD